MIDLDGTVLAAAQAAFGEAVIYFPAGEPGVSLTGIFDDRWVEAKIPGSPVVEEVNVRTVLNVRASVLPQVPQQGDQFHVRGRLYEVAEPAEVDTFGDVHLFLRLADDAQAAMTQGAPGT